MIHDPEIRVGCDDCGGIITLLPPIYFGSRTDGIRDCRVRMTEDAARVLGWICRNGKQFCCERCDNKDL